MYDSVNFLRVIFAILAVVMAVLGAATNYGNRFLPKSVLQLSRYGRANISRDKARFIKAIEVPKSWFLHFYLFSAITQSIILGCIVRQYLFDGSKDYNLLRSILDLVGGESRNTSVSVSTTFLVAILFWFQLCRRLYENIFVSVFSNTKMNILHYGVAFVHYSGSMLSIIAHSPIYSSTSTYRDQASWAEIGASQWFFVALFLLGSLEQYKAHKGFADLRKDKDNKVVTLGHKIPTGGMFDLVSSPNYLAEIIIYVAISGVFKFQNPTWNSVMLWVISNQVTAAVMNHKWYQEKFPEYPHNRKAIIPYIF